MKKFFIIVFVFLNFSLSATEKLIPFQLDGKVGFIDENRNIVFSPDFDDFMYCYDGWAYAYKKEARKTMAYILNCNGRKIEIPYGNAGFVIGKNYYGFTDYGSSTVYSLSSREKYEFKKYRIFTSPDEDFISIDNIFGFPRHNYMNIKGELFFSETTDNNFKLEWFDKELNIGAIRKDGSVTLIDSHLNPISDKKWGFMNPFSCGLALTDKGFIDYDENVKIKITRIPEMDIGFQCNAIPVVITKENNFELYSQEECMGANWAILNSSGKVVKSNIEADSISDFSEDGVAVLYQFVNKKAKYYLINTNGDIINKEPFDKIFPSVNGFSMAQKNGEDYLINVRTGILYNCKDF